MSSRTISSILYKKKYIPDYVKNAANIITLDKLFPVMMVGSYTYEILPFPTDIDMYEIFTGKGSIRAVCFRVARLFRDMGLRIKRAKSLGIYLSELKAGFDERYKLPVGEVIRGKLKNYDPVKLRAAINRLFDKKLLTLEELDEWLRSVLDYPKWTEYRYMMEIFRKKMILRWNLEEIISGRKTLYKNKIITLEKALSQKTLVKIDIFLSLDNRYTEMSNIYKLKTRLPSGKMADITDNVDNMLERILYDMLTFADIQKQKTMKLMKRLWSYSVIKNKPDIIKRIYLLFFGKAARIYQINGSIDTIIAMLNKLPIIPKAVIVSQLHSFHRQLYKMKIRTPLNNINVRTSRPVMLKLLNTTMELLTPEIDAIVVDYMKKHKLYDDVIKILDYEINKCKDVC